MKTMTYDNPSVGCYVDENAGSAEDCNQRTIEFAQGYGFPVPLFSGCFDGLRGSSLAMALDDALSASHSGQCDEDVAALAEKSEISAQLDTIGADIIRAGMKEVGAWDAEQLADDQANRLRAVWQAACDIKENKAEQLSEMADEALEFLNEQETRTGMYWAFEDNSLFLTAGPWTIDETTGVNMTPVYLIEANGESVATAKSLANAKLIALAPTLLAQRNELRDALKYALTWAEEQRTIEHNKPDNDANQRLLDSICSDARAALAKANP